MSDAMMYQEIDKYFVCQFGCIVFYGEIDHIFPFKGSNYVRTKKFGNQPQAFWHFRQLINGLRLVTL